MIHEIRIHFRNPSQPLSEPNVFDNPYSQLATVISELNRCSENYCIVVKIINGPSLQDHGQADIQLKVLIERLSKRELEVFRLAMNGLTVRSIAEKLSISSETVKSHRKKIVGKAGVTKIEEIKDWFLKENF